MNTSAHDSAETARGESCVLNDIEQAVLWFIADPQNKTQKGRVTYHSIEKAMHGNRADCRNALDRLMALGLISHKYQSGYAPTRWANGFLDKITHKTFSEPPEPPKTYLQMLEEALRDSTEMLYDYARNVVVIGAKSPKQQIEENRKLLENDDPR